MTGEMYALLVRLDRYSAMHKAAQERFVDRLPVTDTDWPGKAAALIRAQAEEIVRLKDQLERRNMTDEQLMSDQHKEIARLRDEKEEVVIAYQAALNENKIANAHTLRLRDELGSVQMLNDGLRAQIDAALACELAIRALAPHAGKEPETLVEEKRELDKKLRCVYALLETDLSNIDRYYLRQQSKFMESYAQVLQSRIDRLTPEYLEKQPEAATSSALEQGGSAAPVAVTSSASGPPIRVPWKNPELALTAGGICGKCGFTYWEHHGHIIACPVCECERLRAALRQIANCDDGDNPYEIASETIARGES
jgi:hypothetical protein